MTLTASDVAKAVEIHRLFGQQNFNTFGSSTYNALQNAFGGWPLVAGGGNPTTCHGGTPAVRVPTGKRAFVSEIWADHPRIDSIMFLDMLWNSDAIASTAGTPALSSGTLPARDRFGTANGDGVEIFAVAPSTSAAHTSTEIPVVTYTNSAGTTSRTTQGWNALASTGGGLPMLRAVPQGSDQGVRAITGLTLNETVASATWWFVLARVLRVWSNLGKAPVDDPLSIFTEVYDNSCIWIASRGASAVSNAINTVEIAFAAV